MAHLFLCYDKTSAGFVILADRKPSSAQPPYHYAFSQLIQSVPARPHSEAYSAIERCLKDGEYDDLRVVLNKAEKIEPPGALWDNPTVKQLREWGVVLGELKQIPPPAIITAPVKWHMQH
jgi:hypothetical protein